MSKFLRDLFTMSLSKGGIIIFSLLKSIVIARYLGPEKNGVFAALTVYPTLFMSIGSLGISQATTYIVGKKKHSVEDIKKSVVQLWIISSFVSLTATFFLLRTFSNYGNDLLFVILAIFPIPFSLFNVYNAGILLGQNKVSSYNKIDWIPSFLTLIICFLLIGFFGFGIDGALISMIIGPMFISIVLFQKGKFIRSLNFKFQKSTFRDLLRVGMVFALSSLVINLNYKVDLILLDKFSDDYNLGIYSRGSVLIESLWQIPMLFSPLIFAKSANEKLGSDFYLKVTQLLRMSLLVILIFMIIFVIFSDWIVVFMFGQEFLESAKVINYLTPGILLFAIFKILWVDLAGRGNTWDALKAMTPALIINIILNLIFIPKYGANGAAISSSISYSIGGILILWIYSNKTNISIVQMLKFRFSDFDILRKFLIKKTK